MAQDKKYSALWLWRWVTLFVLTMISFGPMFRNDFVWDDQEFIVRNPAIRGLWPPSRFFLSQGSAAEGAIYPMTGQRPVMAFSLALDYAFWKLNPFGYHLTNLLLHLLCVFGAGLLVQKLSRSRPVGFLTAALFALHPGHAEAVIAFLGRSDLLATLFILLGFWGYVQHRDAEGWRRPLWYFGSLSGFLIACFSKETGLVLLGLLVVYEAFVSGHSQSKPQNLKSKMARLLPFLVVAAGYWLYRGRVLGGQSAGSAWWGGTPYTNFLMMFEVYVRYIRLMAFPLALSPLHTVPVPGGFWDGRVLWGAALLLGSLLVTAWALRKHPWIGLLAAWFLIGLIPVANLIPIPGVVILAERWLYLPSLGLCALGGWVAWILLLRGRGVMKGVGVGFGVVVLVLFGVRSFSWCPVWKTEESIARILVAKAPGSAVGYNNLGSALLARGRTEEALGYFRQALVLKPDYAEAKSNLAMALMEVGRIEEAHQQVREAVELKPRLASAHNNLGVILGKKGEAPSSKEEFREALRLDPNYVEAHYNLGLAYDEAGDLPGSEREFREAVGLNSRHAQSHAALGTVLIRQGKLSEGESEFHTSLRLDPNLAEGHTGLGNVFERQRDFVAAEMEFRTALRLKANYPFTYYNLGNCLLSQGRPAEAEPCFREAIRLKSTFAFAYYNLALALEDQGRLREAVEAYRAYLLSSPGAQDRRDVEQKIARLLKMGK